MEHYMGWSTIDIPWPTSLWSFLRWADTYRDLTFWGIVALGALAMVFHFVWRCARAARSHTCATCRYDLWGLTGNRCPECGTEIAKCEPNASRATRVFGPAPVRSLLIRCSIAATISIAPAWYARNALDVYERGWIALVPSIVLVMGATIDPTATDVGRWPEGEDSWSHELWARLGTERREEFHGCFAYGFTRATMPSWVRGMWLKRYAATNDLKEFEWDRRVFMRVYRIDVVGPRMPHQLSPSGGAFEWLDDVSGLAQGEFEDVTLSEFSRSVRMAIESRVTPDDWIGVGGESGNIETLCEYLVITADDHVHQRVREWLEAFSRAPLAERLRLLRAETADCATVQG